MVKVKLDWTEIERPWCGPRSLSKRRAWDRLDQSDRQSLNDRHYYHRQHNHHHIINIMIEMCHWSRAWHDAHEYGYTYHHRRILWSWASLPMSPPRTLLAHWLEGGLVGNGELALLPLRCATWCLQPLPKHFFLFQLTKTVFDYHCGGGYDSYDYCFFQNVDARWDS